MAPTSPCPNCGQMEWLENPDVHFLPRLVKTKDGSYETDPRRGVYARIWRCNNCMMIMHFWEPG